MLTCERCTTGSMFRDGDGLLTCINCGHIIWPLQPLGKPELKKDAHEPHYAKPVISPLHSVATARWRYRMRHSE